MKTVAKPKVFISYTRRPDDPSNPNDNPEARGLKLVDRLRAAGLDSRIDQYFRRTCELAVHRPPFRRGKRSRTNISLAGANHIQPVFR
jgi:hypothetical protein